LCIGRLSRTKGTVWQYTAIEVVSAYTWANLQVTGRNPSVTWTSVLARWVAADLASRGWRLERLMRERTRSTSSGELANDSATSRMPRRTPIAIALQSASVSTGRAGAGWTVTAFGAHAPAVDHHRVGVALADLDNLQLGAVEVDRDQAASPQSQERRPRPQGELSCSSLDLGGRKPDMLTLLQHHARVDVPATDLRPWRSRQRGLEDAPCTMSIAASTRSMGVWERLIRNRSTPAWSSRLTISAESDAGPKVQRVWTFIRPSTLFALLCAAG
jgi:hypothetical protein